jgi:hypothetical protein
MASERGEVERYDVLALFGLYERGDGRWVEFSDYQQLEEKRLRQVEGLLSDLADQKSRAEAAEAKLATLEAKWESNRTGKWPADHPYIQLQDLRVKYEDLRSGVEAEVQRIIASPWRNESHTVTRLSALLSKEGGDHA